MTAMSSSSSLATTSVVSIGPFRETSYSGTIFRHPKSTPEGGKPRPTASLQHHQWDFDNDGNIIDVAVETVAHDDASGRASVNKARDSLILSKMRMGSEQEEQ